MVNTEPPDIDVDVMNPEDVDVDDVDGVED